MKTEKTGKLAAFLASKNISMGAFVGMISAGVLVIAGSITAAVILLNPPENSTPPAHEHAYSSWTVKEEATCTEKGEESRSCSCGDVETREISATGHSFPAWSTTKEATCTASGTEERTCACGEKETKTIKATGHTFGNWEIVTAATCTAEGAEERICSCGEKETKTISATGHSTTNGTCDYCSYYIGVNPVDILKDIERYPKYLALDCDILESQIERYEMSGQETILKEIIDRVTDMYEYVGKISDACAKSSNSLIQQLKKSCDKIEYPVYLGNARSYISDVNAFMRKCNYLCTDYNVILKTLSK